MTTQDNDIKSCPEKGPGLLPAEWEPLFRAAGIRRGSLDAARSLRGRQTVVGGFLRLNLGREVQIQVDERPALAVLRVVDAGQGRHRYFFEVRWPDEVPPGEPMEAGPAPRNIPPEAGRLEALRRRAAERLKAKAGGLPAGSPPARSGAGNDEDWS